MREFNVIKEFNTVNRRIKSGAVITDALDISPFTYEEREKRGFLKRKNAPPVPAAAVVPPLNKLGGVAVASPDLADAETK